MMRSHTILAVLGLAISSQAALGQNAQCPTGREVVLISKGVNDDPKAVQDAVSQPNRMVLLAANVDITFSNSNVKDPDPGTPFIKLNQCVTLASFEPQTAAQPVPGSGRTPHSIGPVLRYDNTDRNDTAAFIEMRCTKDVDGFLLNGEGARILGIRVFGPDFNDHQTSEKGINIRGCHDAEIANMEVAGWGGAGISVDDADHVKGIPTEKPSEILIKIHGNYIHHNQHSQSDHSAEGYGVDVGPGAFAEISQNVFDYNRHSITASHGSAGGYYAVQNLILKGGGYHNGNIAGIVYERDVHVFDVHGTANCPGPDEATGLGASLGAAIGGLLGGPVGAEIGGVIGGVEAESADQHAWNCGDAGFEFLISQNTIQYSKTTDLKIRGRPKGPQGAIITDNIFARPKGEITLASPLDYLTTTDADQYSIVLQTDDNVWVTGSNQYNDDTFGRYGVCDIDGDGIDDLVLMTGVTWWFSSSGRFSWSFLKADPALLQDVQLGDFDGDGRCDVVKDAGGAKWMIASGGTGDWKPFGNFLGNFLAPLSEVRFGRFDPAIRDHRRGIRPPTHAFWRNEVGFWFVTPLSNPSGWTLIGSSPHFPLSELRFGDFTGDGVTDVLANEEGHWSFSDAARAPCAPLNPTLNDPVKDPNIFIANMDAADNVDDILRLDTAGSVISDNNTATITATWRRSANGRTSWTRFKGYAFTVDVSNLEDYAPVKFGFVGHFTDGPGASILTVDANRIGHFFSPAQDRGPQEWVSQPAGAGLVFTY